MSNYTATLKAYDRLYFMGTMLKTVSSTSLPVHGPERQS